jgi:hypothetical protein
MLPLLVSYMMLYDKTERISHGMRSTCGCELLRAPSHASASDSQVGSIHKSLSVEDGSGVVAQYSGCQLAGGSAQDRNSTSALVFIVLITSGGCSTRQRPQFGIAHKRHIDITIADAEPQISLGLVRAYLAGGRVKRCLFAF